MQLHLESRLSKSRLILCAVTFALSTISATSLASTRTVTKPDNSAVNQRDRKANELTADDQKNNKTDLEITRQIRQALVKNKDLSIYAKNVKIISSGGTVTLKGPVRSVKEVKAVFQVAQATVGSGHIVNELEVAK